MWILAVLNEVQVESDVGVLASAGIGRENRRSLAINCLRNLHCVYRIYLACDKWPKEYSPHQI